MNEVKSTKRASAHTQMHIPWESLQSFLAVAEWGSLSAASKQLRVTQPTVSRRIADLESQLGEALFVRSAGGAALTAFGERLLEPAKRMAEWSAEADRVVEGRDTAPRGSVRITAPPGTASDFLAPFAAWMRTRLPEIQLEVVSTVQYLDLSRREADLAIRLGAPTQRDVVSLASLEHEAAAFAAPSYIKTLPRKCGVADVAWIAWAPPFEQMSPNPELARMVPGFRPSFASDDFLVQLRAAELGLGAIFLGRVRHRFSGASPLVELDLELPTIRRTIHLLAAKSALAIPRVRAVADLLVAELSRTVAPRRR